MTRRLRQLLALAALVAGAAGTTSVPADPVFAQGQQGADLILTNGKIITVDGRFSIAQAVAIRGERIQAVGTNQEIARLAGTTTRRIDLRGRSVVPGLIDNHAHYMEEGVLWTVELRLDGIESRKQALEMIRAKAASLRQGEWVYTLGGWSPDQFADDKRPFAKEELDKVGAEQPGAPPVHARRDLPEQPRGRDTRPGQARTIRGSSATRADSRPACWTPVARTSVRRPASLRRFRVRRSRRSRSTALR